MRLANEIKQAWFGDTWTGDTSFGDSLVGLTGDGDVAVRVLLELVVVQPRRGEQRIQPEPSFAEAEDLRGFYEGLRHIALSYSHGLVVPLRTWYQCMLTVPTPIFLAGTSTSNRIESWSVELPSRPRVGGRVKVR